MRQLHDSYFKRAKREGYFARSIYKLEELDKKFKLFHEGMTVLDLGSSPGSWIQYLLPIVGEEGVVAGVDIKPVKPSVRRKAFVLQQDIASVSPDDFARVATKFDAVVSDMAPNTSGIKAVDQAGSLELCELAWALAEKVLKRGGSFVCKIFESPPAQTFRAELARKFATAKMLKPDASRDESFEMFIVATGFGLSQKEAEARQQKGGVRHMAKRRTRGRGGRGGKK